MTPFAQLGEMRKEASGGSGAVMKLIDRIRRAGKGAMRAPKDFVASSVGAMDGGLHGMTDMIEHRSKGLRELNLGRAGEVGNFVGNVGMGTAALSGVGMGINQMLPAEHGRDWKRAPLPSPEEVARQRQRGIIDNMHFGKEAARGDQIRKFVQATISKANAGDGNALTRLNSATGGMLKKHFNDYKGGGSLWEGGHATRTSLEDMMEQMTAKSPEFTRARQAGAGNSHLRFLMDRNIIPKYRALKPTAVDDWVSQNATSHPRANSLLPGVL